MGDFFIELLLTDIEYIDKETLKLKQDDNSPVYYHLSLMNIKQLAFLFAVWATAHGLPLCQQYIALCENIFLNFSAKDADGIEWAANTLLAPCQYLLDGKSAIPESDPEIPYRFEERFNYTNAFELKMPLSAAFFPIGLVIGGSAKAIAYLFPDVRERHGRLANAFRNRPIRINTAYYRSIGLPVEESAPVFIPPRAHKRRPGDENALAGDKAALKEIAAILEEEKIPYWADCGTCLGAYRYGGAIPWDNDIDIGVLKTDFQNVRQALGRLDPEKYAVQDWSSRGKPESYLKVFSKKDLVLIDIYQYSIDEENRTLNCIVSGLNNIFLTQAWKRHEAKYETPVPFEMIFPLKRAHFDGIAVFVPNQIEEYLHVRYGENIEPSMIYSPEEGGYVKDPGHPYWNNT